MKNILTILLTLVFVTGNLLAHTASQPQGSGSQIDPYQIATLENLYWLSKNCSLENDSLYFIQTADIDASDTKNWDSNNGFSPIGDDDDYSIYYNGKGHTINNLYIRHNSDYYLGLFGTISNSKIDSLGILYCNISNGYEMGGLAGSVSNTIISNCFSSGNLTGVRSGGLIGIASNSQISNCYSSGNLTGGLNGGLIGEAKETDIINCYSTGDLSGGIGGLVGTITGCNISNCFSTGNISGSSYCGGLIGDANSSYIFGCYCSGSISGDSYLGGLIGYLKNSSIENCYCTGRVFGDFTNVGGLIGDNYSSPITHCYCSGEVYAPFKSTGSFIGDNSSDSIAYSYYNKETSNQENSNGRDSYSQTVTGLTTLQMKNAINFIEWNFDSIWNIRSDSTYPAIRQSNNAPFAFADTTTGSLSSLLGNDYDYETNQNNLLLKIDSIFLLTTDITFMQDPTFLLNGDSIKIIYRVGELRIKQNDTLWGNTATSYLKINNSIPELSYDTINAKEDSILTFSLDTMAFDSDMDALSLDVTDSTSHGILSLSNKTLTYQPDTNFYGIDSLKIRISDQLSVSEDWIYIKVKSINDKPVAQDTTITTITDSIISISVNASDIDGNIVSIAIANEPNNGTVAVSGTSITYTPTTEFSGNDTINWYAVDDSNAMSSTATIYITIVKKEETGINEPGSDEIILFPNPTTNNFQIKGFENTAIFYIYSCTGQLVKTSTTSDRAVINISSLNSGTYVVKIITNDIVVTKKLNKQ